MSATVTLQGRLGSDVDLKYTQAGKAVATFRMVTSKPRKKDDGGWEDTQTTWYTVKAWELLGENAAETLRSGDSVIVVGQMWNEEWTTKDGEKRLTLTVNAWDIGPSIKRATAKVTRAERGTGKAATDDAWSTPAPADDVPF